MERIKEIMFGWQIYDVKAYPRSIINNIIMACKICDTNGAAT